MTKEALAFICQSEKEKKKYSVYAFVSQGLLFAMLAKTVLRCYFVSFFLFWDLSTLATTTYLPPTFAHLWQRLRGSLILFVTNTEGNSLKVLGTIRNFLRSTNFLRRFLLNICALNKCLLVWLQQSIITHWTGLAKYPIYLHCKWFT